MTRLLSRFRLRPLRAPRRLHRKGAVLPLVAALSVIIVGMLAFAVDLGYISFVRGQMQSAADSAALAATSQLLDRGMLKGDQTQSSSISLANMQGSRFSSANVAGGVSLTLGPSDVTYGYVANPKDPTSPFDTTHTPYNSARVLVQRTSARNTELGLFFAPIFNMGSMPLQANATATFESNIKGFQFNPNVANQTCLLLPYTLDVTIWDAALAGTGGTDVWKYDSKTKAITAGSDGVREVKLFPTKGNSPGNFGTVDIGDANNSTADIARQILYGPNKADFDKMGGKIELGSGGTLVLQGDTGISAGVKDEMTSIKGQPRVIPLYQAPVTGNGNNSRYTIVRWAGCVILDVQLTGGNKYVTIQPEFAVDSTAYGGGPTSNNSFVYKPLQLSR